MNATDAVKEVAKLAPLRGHVIVVHLSEADPDPAGLEALAADLARIAARSKASVIVLPAGTEVEMLDEREMLARGWIRVGAVGHTTAQLEAMRP